MMLLKIDINKWFSWLNLGIKDPSTASAVEVLLQIAVICLIAFLFTFFLQFIKLIHCLHRSHITNI